MNFKHKRRPRILEGWQSVMILNRLPLFVHWTNAKLGICACVDCVMLLGVMNSWI